MKKILGIMGGMGPAATVYLYSRIMELSHATNDQDHIEVIIHINPKTPDRTKAILYDGISPLPELLRSAQLLVNAGADIILIPCMTAHYYYDDLVKVTRAKIINAIEETSKFISLHQQSVNTVGIVATTGTIRSGLFQNNLKKYGINTVFLPDLLQEKLIMESIYGKLGIKSGYITQKNKKDILEACKYLLRSGADAIIAGCTEIPLVLSQSDLKLPFVDPMEVIAGLTVAQCRGLYL